VPYRKSNLGVTGLGKKTSVVVQPIGNRHICICRQKIKHAQTWPPSHTTGMLEGHRENPPSPQFLGPRLARQVLRQADASVIHSLCALEPPAKAPALRAKRRTLHRARQLLAPLWGICVCPRTTTRPRDTLHSRQASRIPNERFHLHSCPISSSISSIRRCKAMICW